MMRGDGLRDDIANKKERHILLHSQGRRLDPSVKLPFQLSPSTLESLV